LLHADAAKTIAVLDKRLGRKERARSQLTPAEEHIEGLITKRIVNGVLNLQDLQRSEGSPKGAGFKCEFRSKLKQYVAEKQVRDWAYTRNPHENALFRTGLRFTNPNLKTNKNCTHFETLDNIMQKERSIWEAHSNFAEEIAHANYLVKEKARKR